MSHPLRPLLSLSTVAVFLLVPGIVAAQAKKTAAAAAPAPAVKAAPVAVRPAASVARPATPGTAATGHTTTTATAAAHPGPTTATAGHTAPTTTTTNRATTATTPTTATTTASRTTTAASTHTAPSSTGAGGHPAAVNSAGTTHSNFAGRPAPTGAHEMRTASGAEVRTRPNGQRSDLHDERRGLDVHHNLDGNRRISVERADHSRVFAERGGRGYVQHPYMYHDREFGHRTYYDHGRAYDRYYNHYGYRGVYLDVYAPARYYPAGFYGWAYNPWAVPITYSWGWGAAPWYGVYGGYFAPYPVYPSAAFWLTDYLIANSLQAAYEAQAAANAQAAADAAGGAPPPPGGPPVMTPEIKAMISEEVKRQVALENQEATANAQKQDIDPAGSSIARLLSDDQVHVFVVGSGLDLVTNPDGTECPVTEGDVLKIAEPPAPNATSAYAVVLSSKGWRNECRTATAVSVAFTDLQEMQNHMRATIDAGMSDLQAKQGQGGIPPAPPSAKAPPTTAAFAAVAPPPDPNVSQEIAEQTKAADEAEQEAVGVAANSGPSNQGASAAPVASPSTATTTIALGQTIDQVTASLGQPQKVVDLGTKKIYIYPDMKITFKAGKVSTVE